MIIGVNGKIGSGKDTFATMFINRNPSFKQKSFAYKLKKTGSYITGTPEEQWFTQSGKNVFLPEWGITIGEYQQKLGTEAVRRNLHEDAWVIALFADYKPGENWIVTDVRFPNEANYIKDKQQGLLIRLNGDPAKVRELSKRNLTHESEIALDKYDRFDYTINNKPPIENLLAEVIRVEKLLR